MGMQRRLVYSNVLQIKEINKIIECFAFIPILIKMHQKNNVLHCIYLNDNQNCKTKCEFIMFLHSLYGIHEKQCKFNCILIDLITSSINTMNSMVFIKFLLTCKSIQTINGHVRKNKKYDQMQWTYWNLNKVTKILWNM